MILKLLLNTRILWMMSVKKIDECNPYIKLKVLIVFDDIIADVLSNKKLQLFIRSPRMNISIVFITQSYFSAPKSIRLNSALYFIMKNLNKQDKLATNYLSDIDLKTLWSVTKKKNAVKPYHFLVHIKH